MNALLLIYSGNTTFYAKDDNGHVIILFGYTADIGEQFVKFIENESKETPYSLLPEYEDSEKLKEYFRDFLSGLMCEGISSLDLNGNKVKSPMPIELLELDDRFKEPFNAKHFVIHKEDGSFEIRTAYVVSSLYDAVYIELIKLIESGKLIKRCEHCNRIFFPKDRSEKYCDRWVNGDKICKDVGYLYKVENDELLKAYNTAYKTRHAEKQRKIRGKSPSTIKKYNEALIRWRETAKTLLQKAQKAQTQGKAVDEFKNFLNTRLEDL